MAEDAKTTIGGLVRILNELAADLPHGPETPIELGICDGENLQLIDQVDVDCYTHIPVGTAGEPAMFALIRGHHHPDQGPPGALLRGAAADADAELRQLTDGED